MSRTQVRDGGKKIVSIKERRKDEATYQGNTYVAWDKTHSLRLVWARLEVSKFRVLKSEIKDLDMFLFVQVMMTRK